MWAEVGLAKVGFDLKNESNSPEREMEGRVEEEGVPKGLKGGGRSGRVLPPPFPLPLPLHHVEILLATLHVVDTATS